MTRIGRRSRALVVSVLGAMLVGGIQPPDAAAQSAPDPSDVVLVLDFSASILTDQENRNRFGAALERIADRVDETTSDLVGGDVTVTIVQFATRAVDYEGCADLKLLDQSESVARFADCLRSVAGAYRTGLAPALTRQIGIDTNYVAAMERAAEHLGPDAARPVMILFTDGKHDVDGVPVGTVEVVRDERFGDRVPFALLPVGMGLDPDTSDALESGLLGLRMIRDMPSCVSGESFEWPQVVFDTPDQAGLAVATALQNATCTFTVAATPTVAPPIPTLGMVRGVVPIAHDGAIELTWTAPSAASISLVDYRSRCRAVGGEWIESTEGVSLETRAMVDGLTNEVEYECEVAPLGASMDGEWTSAGMLTTPMSRPAAPGKPSVEAWDSALHISVPPAEGPPVSEYRFECSGDDGRTWASASGGGSAGTTAQIGNLTNGVEYVCRAFATNSTGLSDASPISDAVSPCGSVFACNMPTLLILGVVLVAGLLAVVVAMYRERSRGYVVAVIDVVHTANLGQGSRLGIAFVRDPASKRVTDIRAARGPDAEITIRRHRGGTFQVDDRVGRHVTTSGESIVAIDAHGVRHELVLRAFRTSSASPVSTRG